MKTIDQEAKERIVLNTPSLFRGPCSGMRVVLFTNRAAQAWSIGRQQMLYVVNRLAKAVGAIILAISQKSPAIWVGNIFSPFQNFSRGFNFGNGLFGVLPRKLLFSLGIITIQFTAFLAVIPESIADEKANHNTQSEAAAKTGMLETVKDGKNLVEHDDCAPIRAAFIGGILGGILGVVLCGILTGNIPLLPRFGKK